MVGPGCIEESERRLHEVGIEVEIVEVAPVETVDVNDSEVAGPEVDGSDVGETAELVDSGEVSDVAEVSEVAEVEVETEIEEVPECTEHIDCFGRPGASVCSAWLCVERVCELVATNEGGNCEDGDRCTSGDFCQAGVCQRGPGKVTCPAVAAGGCVLAECRPATGCGTTPAAIGVECDNGSGAEPGACMVGGVVPSDRCDGAGTCVDSPAGNAPGASALAGKWFAVYTSFGRFAAPTTARALLSIAAGANTFAIGAARAYATSPFVEGGKGYFCPRADGSLDGAVGSGAIGIGEVRGHQIEERLAVVADSSDGLAVLLRADEGSSTQVHGRYAYFQTTIVFGGASPATWQGTMDFDNGCLTGGSLETDPLVAGTYDVVTSGIDCLTASGTPGEGSLFQLLTHVRAREGDTQSYPIDYRGAIGRGGDIVVMVKDQNVGGSPSTTPEYGIVILVRQPSAAPVPITGDWVYNLQLKLGADAVRRDIGELSWDPDGAISGDVLTTLDGDKVVSSGWFALDNGQKTLSQKVIVGGLPFYQVGFMAPSKRFVVGWNVAAPSNPNVAALLGNTPRYGSMLLMLRP